MVVWFSNDNVMTNKKIQNKQSYPIRSIRLSQKTWILLKTKRWKSMQSWEKFISEIVKK